jgi:hypothetical protein
MSKFDGLRAATNARKRKSPAKRQAATTSTLETVSNEKKRGRPRGKRTNPDYVQTSIYLHKTTLSSAKIALLEDGRTQDLSELVGQLLAQWLHDWRKPRT